MRWETAAGTDSQPAMSTGASFPLSPRVNHSLNPRARSFWLYASVFGLMTANVPSLCAVSSVIRPARYPARNGSWATVHTGEGPGSAESMKQYGFAMLLSEKRKSVSSCMTGAMMYAQQSDEIIALNWSENDF